MTSQLVKIEDINQQTRRPQSLEARQWAKFFDEMCIPYTVDTGLKYAGEHEAFYLLDTCLFVVGNSNLLDNALKFAVNFVSSSRRDVHFFSGSVDFDYSPPSSNLSVLVAPWGEYVTSGYNWFYCKHCNASYVGTISNVGDILCQAAKRCPKGAIGNDTSELKESYKAAASIKV